MMRAHKLSSRFFLDTKEISSVAPFGMPSFALGLRCIRARAIPAGAYRNSTHPPPDFMIRCLRACLAVPNDQHTRASTILITQTGPSPGSTCYNPALRHSRTPTPHATRPSSPFVNIYIMSPCSYKRITLRNITRLSSSWRGGAKAADTVGRLIIDITRA